VGWNYLLVIYLGVTKHLLGGTEKMHEQYLKTASPQVQNLNLYFPKMKQTSLLHIHKFQCMWW